jgi:hypothetical protein
MSDASTHVMKPEATRTLPMSGSDVLALSVAAVGGALAAIGSLLPWAVAHTSVGDIGRNGMADDGYVTLALGAFIVFMAGATALSFRDRSTPVKWLGIAAMVAALAISATGALNWIDLDRAASKVPRGLGSLDPGAGMYLTAAGGIVATVGSALIARAGVRRDSVA